MAWTAPWTKVEVTLASLSFIDQQFVRNASFSADAFRQERRHHHQMTVRGWVNTERLIFITLIKRQLDFLFAYLYHIIFVHRIRATQRLWINLN